MYALISLFKSPESSPEDTVSACMVNEASKMKIDNMLPSVFLCISEQIKGVLKIGAKIQLISIKKK
ncbi:hypothetical protein ULMA_08350 [Patiriisocius marinus]|uniref:Uncharacterized protein n=1 Tax=Patiriisocius marinus TaxID=1397112 RepID=A0A5J4J2Q2_9FLAO|nr:hypothetical protein ULMA_08350 [Patiriisocius marinus]